MESIKELYKIGPGPSSSHTLAPRSACMYFKERYTDAVLFEVDLYGSLSLTGKGHHTDQIVQQVFSPKQCIVNFKLDWVHDFENGLIIKGYDYKNEIIAHWTVFSLGGGTIKVLEEDLDLQRSVYPQSNFEEVKEYCRTHQISLDQYVFKYEPDLKVYLNKVISQMLQTVKIGLETSGILPGPLKLKRVAKELLIQAQSIEDEDEKNQLLLCAYAYGATEENAAGGICTTAPTLGASGIIASLVYYYYHNVGISRDKLCNALAVAGVFGNIIKQNATISGAVGGCQAEIGSACSMGSAMVSYLYDSPLKVIETAAEMGMEHHLGLTCDPVGGYVMIPCIERNAVGTLRCINSAKLAKHLSKVKQNIVSFDNVVNTMNYTGKKLAIELKETSLGGLATEIKV